MMDALARGLLYTADIAIHRAAGLTEQCTYAPSLVRTSSIYIIFCRTIHLFRVAHVGGLLLSNHVAQHDTATNDRVGVYEQRCRP
jgi:hypothetical protein